MTAPFDQVTINTHRLLLRPLCTSDASALFALRSDENVVRYIGQPRWTSIDSAQERIAVDMNAMQKGDYLKLGIVLIEDASLIGTCTLFHFDQQCRRAEIGYELRPDKWGQGYMNEALIPLLKFGFTELALNRIEADIDPHNKNSAKTLERLGFQKEGYLRERWIFNGEKSDSIIYGLLISNWRGI